jgi:hypothetical protein
MIDDLTTSVSVTMVTSEMIGPLGCGCSCGCSCYCDDTIYLNYSMYNGQHNLRHQLVYDMAHDVINP